MPLAALQALRDLDAWMAIAIVLKTLTYCATFAAAGGVIFWITFRDDLSVRDSDELRRFIERFAWAGVLVSVLRIAAINGLLTGELSGMMDMSMSRMVLASPEGLATMLRIAGLFFIALICRSHRQGVHSRVSMGVAVVALTAFALVGHAGDLRLAKGSGLLPQAALCLHLIAVAFWLGALWPLFRRTHDLDWASTASLMDRFGNMAAWSVGLLAASGMLLLWLLIDLPAALWASAYGQFFLLKLLLVTALLALAARNKWQLAPRLHLADGRAGKELRHAIVAEIAVAGMILLITAGITTIAGPG